jgi:hypothetical protein
LRLVFVGDISVDRPVEGCGAVMSPFPGADCVIANLEGPIVSREDGEALLRKQAVVVYNSLDVLEVLKRFGVQAVSLANNHTFDHPGGLRHTTVVLAKAGIAPFGAGDNLAQAGEPVVLERGGTSVRVYAFGWEVIGCPQAGADRMGVNPLQAEYMLGQIRRCRAKDRTSFVVFVVHWNYELELFPLPAHRRLAHDLVREGVDAVIGMHPHVAQGAEMIGRKLVAYSLGNWFFRPRQIGHYWLSYPAISFRELALELHIEGRSLTSVSFHWFRFDPDHDLAPVSEVTEGWDGLNLRVLTPYASMNDPEYGRWFGLNRTRRRGLPIYYDYRDSCRNRIADSYVRLRHRAIQALVGLRLKGGPRL